MSCKSCLLFFLGFFGRNLSAQTEPFPVDSTFNIIELQQWPNFPGGEANMFKYFFENFHFPASTSPDSIHGSKIVLNFVVDTLGQLKDFCILKDMCKGCGQEAIKVLQSMPAWIPGEYDGRKVPVRYTLPLGIRFE